MAAIFLLAFGSKLWLVFAFGSDVPFWDQWNGEANLLYKPLLEHGLASVEWFSAHNEHRIAAARATSVLLLYINGQWDPLVQMVWEALCVGAIAAAFCAIALKFSPSPRMAILLWTLAIVGIAAPYGWENTLAGFQTPFYYLIFLSFALLYLCSAENRISAKCASGAIAIGAILLFTLASGVLTCLSASFVMLLRVVYQRGRNIRVEGTLCAFLLALAVVGFVITPAVPQHAVLRAKSIAEWWAGFYAIMGWPAQIPLVKWLPFILFGARTIRFQRISSPHLFVIGLAAFVILNTAAIALARATSVNDFLLDSRYTDIAWLGWVVNLWAVLILAFEVQHRYLQISLTALALGYFIFSSSVLIDAGAAGLNGASNRERIYAVESRNVRNYVGSGDFNSLADKPLLEIPFPSADLLRRQLDDPTIRSILPPGIRPTVLERIRVDGGELYRHGFVQPGVPVTTPPAPANAKFFGSYGSGGERDKAFFDSPVIVAQGSYLTFKVAGFLGNSGLSMYLESVPDKKRINVVPHSPAGNAWQPIIVKIPGTKYRIVAEDQAQGASGWFAFTDPVETGRLRPLVDLALSYGASLTVLGFLCLIAISSLFPVTGVRIRD